MELVKTNRINRLYDFYGTLLTKKQQQYLDAYYRQDFSLGEIAEHFQVSRQAVYDNLQRSEEALILYEEKLHLVEQYRARRQALAALEAYIQEEYADEELEQRLRQLKLLD